MASLLTDMTPVLALVGGGIVLLICSTVSTVVWRRADVTIGEIPASRESAYSWQASLFLSSRGWRGLSSAAHDGQRSALEPRR